MQNLENTIRVWLQCVGLKVSGQYLKYKLLSHPDYPSLLSITETLDDLGIENCAVEIEKKQLQDMPIPFLAHLNGQGGSFVLISDKDIIRKKFKKFYERWSGIVVMAEKPEKWQDEENEEYLQKEKQQQRKNIVALIVILFFSLMAVFNGVYFLLSALLLSAITGVIVSWLAVSQDIGIKNKWTDRICGDTDDCGAVIKKKRGRFLEIVNLSDASIIYFTSNAFLLLIFSFTNSIDGYLKLFSWLSAATLPIILFSVYYQWRVVQKWCRLCLVIDSILLIQFALLIPYLSKEFVAKGLFTAIELAGLVYLTVGIGWSYVKSLLREKKDLESEKFALKRFKNNLDIFRNLLYSQKKVDTSPWPDDLQIGNPNAKTQIMVACNPFCGPCAKTHEALHNLVEKRKDLGLTIRFTIKSESKEDKRTLAAENILGVISDYDSLATDEEPLIKFRRTVLKDWYAKMNMESFAEKYPRKNNHELSQLLKRHEGWTEESNISFTPTIFINNFELSRLYSVNDLPALLNGVKENKIEEKETENILMQLA